MNEILERRVGNILAVPLILLGAYLGDVCSKLSRGLRDPAEVLNPLVRKAPDVKLCYGLWYEAK